VHPWRVDYYLRLCNFACGVVFDCNPFGGGFGLVVFRAVAFGLLSLARLEYFVPLRAASSSIGGGGIFALSCGGRDGLDIHRFGHPYGARGQFIVRFGNTIYKLNAFLAGSAFFHFFTKLSIVYRIMIKIYRFNLCQPLVIKIKL
jgi:hypothetical protein